MEVSKIHAIQIGVYFQNRRREHEKFIIDGTLIE